jgi:uncharacterized protein (TIGR03437 family)
MPKSIWLITLLSLAVLLTPNAFGQRPGYITPVGTVPGIALPNDFPLPPNFVTANRVSVAPGQIVTLQFTGLKTILPLGIATASTIPLPFTLSGISVTIDQGDGGAIIEPFPLLAIFQANYCASSAPSPGCVNNVTYITVQIPFELSFTLPTLWGISENNGADESGPFDLNPVSDNIHIVTTCDKGASFTNCQAVVAHADGTVISATSPAKPSEEIVIYAFGLGTTTPAVQTGAASPTPAAVVTSPVNIQFDFRPNAGPSRPYTGVPLPAPLFVGLTPGQVGLYQINVKLPGSFPPLPPCDQTSPASGGSTNIVQSNLTVDIGGANSFDAAATCVQMQQ